MQEVDLLLELLNEGRAPHKIDKIIDKSALSRMEASVIIDFLAKYEFIILDKSGNARVSDEVHEFLREVKQEGGNESI